MLKTYRDKKYLDSLRESPCILTGMETNEGETVDPAHVGKSGGGMGMKTHDYDCLPLIHNLHSQQHQMGEDSFWDWAIGRYMDLPDFVQAYARMRYLRWLVGVETDRELIERIKDDRPA